MLNISGKKFSLCLFTLKIDVFLIVYLNLLHNKKIGKFSFNWYNYVVFNWPRWMIFFYWWNFHFKFFKFSLKINKICCKKFTFNKNKFSHEYSLTIRYFSCIFVFSTELTLSSEFLQKKTSFVLLFFQQACRSVHWRFLKMCKFKHFFVCLNLQSANFYFSTADFTIRW